MNDAEKLKAIEDIIDPITNPAMPEATREQLGRAIVAIARILRSDRAFRQSPRTCQVEHPHWEGPMICGNPLPCPRHGGR